MGLSSVSSNIYQCKNDDICFNSPFLFSKFSRNNYFAFLQNPYIAISLLQNLVLLTPEWGMEILETSVKPKRNGCNLFLCLKVDRHLEEEVFCIIAKIRQFR